ncbi:hypothetical protein CORC01_11330 [Colletotrichum orchidophilum]|uniref:Uncharacterized protein n=1 Tax=Colletotrichum orchidophilum TaxID=1209926 RepID=A0A1G4AW42_9PEZI|nr:uncharacterized protein CORC01_11330 [Colletotrichum orchidophilum]OHE93380.1 hypothetical protein CORC01_11330 [Colletotrichum orchidophilum]
MNEQEYGGYYGEYYGEYDGDYYGEYDGGYDDPPPYLRGHVPMEFYSHSNKPNPFEPAPFRFREFRPLRRPCTEQPKEEHRNSKPSKTSPKSREMPQKEEKAQRDKGQAGKDRQRHSKPVSDKSKKEYARIHEWAKNVSRSQEPLAGSSRKDPQEEKKTRREKVPAKSHHRHESRTASKKTEGKDAKRSRDRLPELIAELEEPEGPDSPRLPQKYIEDKPPQLLLEYNP